MTTFDQAELDRFNKELSRSETAVDMAANWLIDKGFAVNRPDTLYPEGEGDMSNRDSGDLELPMIVEVKWTRYDWDNHPWPGVILDETYKVKEKWPRIFAYMVFGVDLDRFWWVDVHATRRNWYTHEWVERDVPRIGYVVYKSDCTLYSLKAIAT